MYLTQIRNIGTELYRFYFRIDKSLLNLYFTYLLLIKKPERMRRGIVTVMTNISATSTEGERTEMNIPLKILINYNLKVIFERVSL